MVELTTDTKLRKEALSKDLTLDDLIWEGEANELARSRNMVLEGGDKKIKKLQIDKDTNLSEDQANFLIQKLKKAGKYSKQFKDTPIVSTCPRCINLRKSHDSDNCFLKNKECRVCKKTGHMGGAKMCKEKSVNEVKQDFNE